MAKKAYVGVNDVARTVKTIYVGVNGVARKVIKGYVGVNGVAQVFWDGGAGGLIVYDCGTWGYVPDGTAMNNYSTDFQTYAYTNKCLWYNSNGYVWEERTVNDDTFITKSNVNNSGQEESYWYIPLKTPLYGNLTITVEAKWREKSTYSASSNYFMDGLYYLDGDVVEGDDLSSLLPEPNEDYESFTYTIQGGDYPWGYVALLAYNGAPQIRKIAVDNGRTYWKQGTHEPSTNPSIQMYMQHIQQPLKIDHLLTTTYVYSENASTPIWDVTESVTTMDDVVYKIMIKQHPYGQDHYWYDHLYVSEQPFTMHRTVARNGQAYQDGDIQARAITLFGSGTYYVVLGYHDYSDYYARYKLNYINMNLGDASEVTTFNYTNDEIVWCCAYILFDGTIS